MSDLEGISAYSPILLPRLMQSRRNYVLSNQIRTSQLGARKLAEGSNILARNNKSGLEPPPIARRFCSAGGCHDRQTRRASRRNTECLRGTWDAAALYLLRGKSKRLGSVHSHGR